MKWSREAQDLVSRVPFFIRAKVKKRVEEEALRAGSNIVLPIHVRQAQKLFLNSMEREITGYRVEACFGLHECPNSVVNSPSLVNRIEKLLASKNILGHLKKRVSGSLKFHHEFKVTIANCPNACSRPQIVDIGIIGTSKPVISSLECTICGECTEICEENALKIIQKALIFESKRCLGCGQCIKKCQSGAITEAYTGFRILIGGKLGRHPRLGYEIFSLSDEDKVISFVDYAVDEYLNYMNKKNCFLRFGDFLEEIGLENFMP